MSPLVMVIDDDPMIASFVVAALEDEGYRVLTALGQEALRLAHERNPALVLLDKRMPELDGAEIVRRLRDDPETAEIPLVLMSSDTRTPGEIASLLNGWLPKPFPLDRLYEVVAQWAPLD